MQTSFMPSFTTSRFMVSGDQWTCAIIASAAVPALPGSNLHAAEHRS